MCVYEFRDSLLAQRDAETHYEQGKIPITLRSKIN
jgi:hypothetical protein